MNVKLVDMPKKKTIEFPRLMKMKEDDRGSRILIVLMRYVVDSLGTGIVLLDSKLAGYPAGTYVCTWSISDFEPYDGIMELSN